MSPLCIMGYLDKNKTTELLINRQFMLFNINDKYFIYNKKKYIAYQAIIDNDNIKIIILYSLIIIPLDNIDETEIITRKTKI